MDQTRSKHRLGGILSGPQVARAVRAEAEKVAARARVGAPVDSGEYAAGIVVTTEARGGTKHDRPVAHVVATAPHSAAVEFGNSHSAAQYPLLRALRSV